MTSTSKVQVSKKTNLSQYDLSTVPDATGMKVGIVVSEWNNEVTGALLDGALDTLMRHGVNQSDIIIEHVPGSFELINGASRMTSADVEAVIAIGCVVRGDTPHFDYICQGTTFGLSQLNIIQRKPVIYGLITVNDMQQAIDRCGGCCGNKGDECAVTAIKMIYNCRKTKTKI